MLGGGSWPIRSTACLRRGARSRGPCGVDRTTVDAGGRRVFGCWLRDYRCELCDRTQENRYQNI